MKIIKQNSRATVYLQLYSISKECFTVRSGTRIPVKKTDIVASTQERLQLCMLAFAKSNQIRVIVKAHGPVISNATCTNVKIFLKKIRAHKIKYPRQ